MGYVYLSYVVITALFINIECRRKKRSLWWTVIVLLVPLVAVYVLFKTRGRPGLLYIVACLVTFAVAAGAEGYLYASWKEKHRYDHLPPVLKQMVILNEKVRESTIELYDLSGRLDSISMVQSRITDIRTTLTLIENLRNKIQGNQHAIDAMIGFAKDHQQVLVRKNMGWIFAIQKFYSNPAVARHNQYRSGYYTALENLLAYTHKNFDNIMELKSQVHMKNYDVYYLRYRRAADRLNRINRERIRFQNEFVHQYPEVKPFLPGTHHLEPFKFWDKFSF